MLAFVEIVIKSVEFWSVAHRQGHKNLISCGSLLYNAVIRKGGVFMDRTEYKNQHIKERYNRINFVIPKGKKDYVNDVPLDYLSVFVTFESE